MGSKTHAWLFNLYSACMESSEGAGTWTFSAFHQLHGDKQAVWIGRAPLAVEFLSDKAEEQFWWLPVLFSLMNSPKKPVGSMYTADAECLVLVPRTHQGGICLLEVSKTTETNPEVHFSSLLLLEADGVCLRFHVRQAWTLQPHSTCPVAQEMLLTL